MPPKPKELFSAARIGIRHEIIQTNEFADPNYLRNDGARCYYCKSELYDAIAGRLNLFVRSDEQEQAWRWVEPVLHAWFSAGWSLSRHDVSCLLAWPLCR